MQNPKITFSLENLMQTAFYPFCDLFADEELQLSVQINEDEIALIVESDSSYTFVYPDHLHPYSDDFAKNISKLSELINTHKNTRGVLRSFAAEDMRCFVSMSVEFISEDNVALHVQRAV